LFASWVGEPAGFSGCFNNTMDTTLSAPLPASLQRTAPCDGSVDGGALVGHGEGKSSYTLLPANGGVEFHAIGSSDASGTGGSISGPYFNAGGGARGSITIDFEVTGGALQYAITGQLKDETPSPDTQNHGTARLTMAGQVFDTGTNGTTTALNEHGTLVPGIIYRLEIRSNARARSSSSATRTAKARYDVTLRITP